MHRTVSSFFVLIMASIIGAACSSSSTTGDAVDGGLVDASPVSLGQSIVVQNDCASCHGQNLAGTPTTIPHFAARTAPNLTPDPDTGIGGWTDDQIKNAIRTGVDDQGASLCWVMPRFSAMTDGDVDHVVAFLRALPAVKQDIPDSDCPLPDGGVASADAEAK